MGPNDGSMSDPTERLQRAMDQKQMVQVLEEPSMLQQYKERKDRLQRQMDKLDRAIAILQANPELQELLTIIKQEI